MILAGVARADAVLHQTGQAGQHGHRRIQAGGIHAAVQHDLPLGDVARQVGDGVGNVVAGHGQDRDLGHRALAALDDTGALVQAGQIGIQVAGEALAARDLALGGRELAQGLAVACHIGQDDQHVLVQVKGQILGHGQRGTGGNDTLNDGVIGQIQQHDHTLHGTAALKALAEVGGNVILDAHSGKDDGEVRAIGHAGLTDDLDGQLVVLHAGAGEDRQLLAADQRGQAVNRRNAGVDVVAGVDTADGVDGRAVDIAAGHRVDIAQTVNRAAQTVQHAAQQLGA